MADFTKISPLVVLLVLGTLAQPAWAESTSGPTPPDSDRCVRDKKCRGMVDSARRLSQSGQYQAALVSYQTAYANWPSTWLLLNIGRLQHKTARPRDAIETYRRVLSDPEVQSDPELKSKTQGYLREAQTAESLTPQKSSETPAASESKPIYKKWWFWTAIGGAAVVVIAVGVGVGVGTRGTSPSPYGEDVPVIRF